MRHLPNIVKHFCSDQTASVPILFAVCFISVALSAGAAIDFTRMAHTKSALSDALDAAILASGNDLVEGRRVDSSFRKDFESFFYANIEQRIAIPKSIVIDNFSADEESGEITAKATAQVEMTLMKFAGHNEMAVSTEHTALFSAKDIEVAMTLDVTGSMAGSKINALKRAASDAVDILMPTAQPKGVRIGLVPYSSAVNAGAWADRATNGATIGSARKCVTERVESAYSDTSFRKVPVGAATNNCPSIVIQPLTGRKSDLKRDIDRLSTGGSTAGHLGIAWSYYMLSDKWKSLWPKESDPQRYSDEVRKVSILMTDGSFNQSYTPVSSSEAAVRTCADMKSRKKGQPGIVIYSIAFKAPADAQRLLQSCASPDTATDTHYFSADSEEELRIAFRSIATSIKRLRITN